MTDAAVRETREEAGVDVELLVSVKIHTLSYFFS